MRPARSVTELRDGRGWAAAAGQVLESGSRNQATGEIVHVSTPKRSVINSGFTKRTCEPISAGTTMLSQPRCPYRGHMTITEPLHVPSLGRARTVFRSEAIGGGTTARERAVLSFFVLWVGFGLAIDTRKHNTEASIDTFFTSAHALLYAGWFACATYLLFIARKRMQSGAKGFAAIPSGLVGASAGAALFGVSGLGDMGWHIKWGVEQNTEILFSPTHLGLMVSFLLMAFGPIRALWMERSEVKPLDMLPVALATGVIGTIFSVFLGFNAPFASFGPDGIFALKNPTQVSELDQFLQISSITGCLLATVAIIGPILLLLRRWDIPFGTATIVFSTTALATLVSVDFQLKSLMLAMATAGLVMDVLWFALRRLPSRRVAFRVFGFLSPLALWVTYIAFTLPGRSMQWSREFWTGTLLWTAIIGVGLSAVLLPPRATPTTHLD